ncbi:MAG: arginine decarboxylase, pyruvoyl-dependent [Magnetococcus sp. DMHC-6]
MSNVEPIAAKVSFELLTRYFLVKGVGDATYPITAFDRALLAAGVGDVNLVRLSSILPPGCQKIAPVPLLPGRLVPIAYATMNSTEIGQQIASAVAVGVPVDPELPGLIMEHSGYGSGAEIEAIVRGMVEENMAYRGRAMAEILSISSEGVVQTVSSTFAGVVLLP